MNVDPSELRIGNLVFDEDGEPIYIGGIYPVDNRKLWRYADSANNTGNVSHLRPIPLTEKWLLDFQFKKLDKYTFVLDGVFVYKRKAGFFSGSSKRRISVAFVHRLQNLFNVFTEKELKFTPNDKK